MDLQVGDVVWWESPDIKEFGESGVYRVAYTPFNLWDCVVLESKNNEFVVANLKELEKLNLPWN